MPKTPFEVPPEPRAPLSSEKKKDANDDYITINFQDFGKNLSVPVAMIISALILAVGIGAGLYFGLRERGVTTTTTGTTTPPADTNKDPFALSNFPEAAVTVGNGAKLGSLQPGKVVIVEFSDLMCTYCRQFTSGYLAGTNQKSAPSSYTEIMSNYVTTGKAAFVFRQYPLPGHEPAATQSSLIAECVRKFSGDGALFKFTEQFFEQLDKISAPGDTGLNMNQSVVDQIIISSGADKNQVMGCYNEKSTQSIIDNDVVEVAALQSKLLSEGKITQGLGTPTIVIGILQSDGETVVGRLVPGAFPFQAFKNVIEEQLNR